jgi:hypothetical protein
MVGPRSPIGPAPIFMLPQCVHDSEDGEYSINHSREEPNGTKVTFDKEVHFWEAELSMVTEAHRLLEEMQRESCLAFGHRPCL